MLPTVAGVIGHDRRVRLPSRRRLARLADALIPWGVGVFLVLTAIDEYATPTWWLPLVVSIALGVVQAAALRWRRRHPETVTVVVLVAGLAYQLLVPEVTLPIAGFFAVGSLAAARAPRVSLIGLTGLLALSATNFFTTTVGDTLFTMGLAVGAWALGEVARTRRVAVEEEARRAVTEERARIARELHDVIAHSVSVIVVQAGAADHVFEERPDQARAALRSIEAAGRDAQRELGRLLAAVRPDVDSDPAQPQPGLDRLGELAAPLRAAGLRVEVRREGAARALSAGVDLSAYRIVQEALTNTLRHANATRAEVTVRYSSDAVEVSVLDDGRDSVAEPAEAGGGHGIAGMRERAALVGGELEAGRLPGGGYRVHARLPLEPAA
jgi:signal transduction histidine kinase